MHNEEEDLVTDCLRRKHNGHSVDELPFRAAWGVIGSWICLIMNIIFCIAQFYAALYPVGGPYLSAEYFFEQYLAAPVVILLYVIWKAYSFIKVPKDRPLYVKIRDIDIYSGMREAQREMISGTGVSDDQRRESIAEMREENKKQGVGGYLKASVRAIF
jgi:yeast amino acid transporter